MQVILKEDVPNLGQSGDLVEVKSGYCRNYLIPRGLAAMASARNVKQLEHEKRAIAQREAKLLRTAQALKDKVEGTAVNIAKQVGEDEKLYGSVTSKEIADVLAAKGVMVDRKKIQIREPIRSLGVHTVVVSLGREMNAELKVWVVAQE